MFTVSNVLFFALVFICVYVAIYSIVDRICRCIETRCYKDAFIKINEHIMEENNGEEQKD